MCCKSSPSLIAILTVLLWAGASWAQPAVAPGEPDPAAGARAFVTLLTQPPKEHKAAYNTLRETWEKGYVVMALEVVHLSRDRGVESNLLKIMKKKTGKNFGFDVDRWYEWLWEEEETPAPYYAEFKAAIYSLIDEKFQGYFDSDETSLIRLDEVRWGGVPQDGIPPLRSPKMIGAAEANYLKDSHVVFGIKVGDDARAYPKRILAWHEMFVDTVGGVPVAGVYCTLCGTVILYETTHKGVEHALGTSGFLYRSNKLMYDQGTQSLWNTMWGQPVIGPLAGKGIELKRGSVVTTTWGEWRRRHPDTKVLSLDTGHRRDYSEGAAYRSYFATDDLMFNVPKTDKRLKNKDEVFGLMLSEQADQPLAISVDYLDENPIHHDKIGTIALVVLTDTSGAARAYEVGEVEIASWDRDRTATDKEGKRWILHEDRLEAEDGSVLPRLPAHRAFWFGWFSAYSHTRLIS